ncbi:MAG TPA: hypothetical protein PK351_11865, partial [Spirochaetota bacterium]|nr:hypothetical protein [Spirochaetota bacterium]
IRKILKNYNFEHELHIVVNSEMKKRIASIGKKFNISISGLIVYILQLYTNRIKKIYCFGEEDGNKYERIDGDARIHIYVSKQDYRFLKKIHADLNFFSMGCLLRRIILLFLEEYEKLGITGVEMKCSIITLKLFLRLTKIKKWEKSRELSHFSGNTTPFYKAIYNDCYQVVGFETYY